MNYKLDYQMKTIIYMHICGINNWKEIVKNLFDRIRSSGLYDKIDEIRYGFIGEYDCLKDEIFKDPKFCNVLWSSDINLRETVTLNKLWYAAKEEEFNVLYLHSKGVSYNGQDQRILNWVEYLTHYNVDRHEDCIENLNNGADVVGVITSNYLMFHYSGNFWWSKSVYINRSVQFCVHYAYNAPEFWITSPRNGLYVDLNYSSDRYDGTSSNIEYKNKPLNIKKYKYTLEIT
jgi:hypothetical protein